jgi:hypothetical protein
MATRPSHTVGNVADRAWLDEGRETVLMASNKWLTGRAGVHFVAFQLSSRGYTVSFTDSKDVYLRVAYPSISKSVAIKVKTSTKAYRTSGTWGTHWSWRLDEPLSERKRRDLLLAFWICTADHQPNPMPLGVPMCTSCLRPRLSRLSTGSGPRGLDETSGAPLPRKTPTGIGTNGAP